jgi:TPP-dependent 2-oxoacid decarboxylase
MATSTIADYILFQLKEAEVDTIFGVPGDFMLHFLDRVVENGLKYVGNCNGNI